MKKRLLILIAVSLCSLGLVSFTLAGARAVSINAPEPGESNIPAQMGYFPTRVNHQGEVPGSASTQPDLQPSTLTNPHAPSSIDQLMADAKAASRRGFAGEAQSPSQIAFNQPGVAIQEARSHPAGIQASEALIQSGVTADLVLERVYGTLNAGDWITVTRLSDGAYGSAQADGSGFFWTSLFPADGSGVPVDLQPGEQLDVYAGGALVASLTPLDVTGGFDVLADHISGAISGDTGGTQVEISVGLWGGVPGGNFPSYTATTNASGIFSLTVDIDLGAENLVAVDSSASGGWGRTYLYPDPTVFLAGVNGVIAGYAPVNSTVVATVYNSFPSDIRWQDSQDAPYPFGFYQFNGVDIQPGNLVEVQIDGGSSLFTTLANLGNLSFDTDLDQVSGVAPPGANLRLNTYVWQNGVETYVETHTLATPGFTFSATFPQDLRPSGGVDIIIPDVNGNQTHLVGGPPFVKLILDPESDYDCVQGRVDGPNLPVTLTIQTASGVYTRTNPLPFSGPGNQVGGWDVCFLVWGADWGPVNFTPGDIVTLRSPTWQGQVTVQDLNWTLDTALEQVSGMTPPGEVGVSYAQWNSYLYPLNGAAWMRGGSGVNYSLDFSGFDLRDGGYLEVQHFDPLSDYVNDQRGWGYYLQVEPPYGIYGHTPFADEPVTATLYDEAHTWLADNTQDDDWSPFNFWFSGFPGYNLLPGYWVQVTAGSGWTAEVQIALVTVGGDPDTDLVTGQAPKQQIYLEGGNDASGFSYFTPVDGYALNTAWLGHDLGLGDGLAATLSALNGDFQRQNGWVGELRRVEFWLNESGDSQMWGEAQPGETVTITTPLQTVTAYADPNCGGCWDANAGELFPGDVVYVTSGAGTQPVTAVIPDPLVAQVDSDLDQVWGQIGGWYSQTVEIYGNWPDGYREVTTDLSGNFLATYNDIPRGVDGYIRFVNTINFVDVIYHRPFVDPALVVHVNYAHDWVEGNFEAGHTIWITLTDGLGVVKATASGVSGPIPWWGDQSGFSTGYNLIWSVYNPDIQSGDWVYALADNGKTTSVHLGEITGILDVNADTIDGAVYAPWFTQTLDGDCSVWEDGGPGTGFTVDPNGGAYSCDFGAMGWDLLPGDDVGVSYREPDADVVYNVFRDPAPELWIYTWADNTPGEGGNYNLWVRYGNRGDAASPGTTISSILEGGMTYLGDTSGLPHTGSGTPGDPLVWQVGRLPVSYLDRQFEIFVQVGALQGQVITHTAQIENSLNYSQNNPWDKYSVWTGIVGPYSADLSLNKYAWTGDPLIDTDYIYQIDVCNNSESGTRPVTLTDTMPYPASLVDWWGEHLGWQEVSRGDHQLVLTRTVVGGYQCQALYLRAHLDASAWAGMPISNTATITTSGELDPGNNYAETWQTASDYAHTNLWISKDWESGQLVPGGDFFYSFSYGNSGNLPAQNVLVTSTLPQNTTFRYAQYWTPNGGQLFTPTQITSDYLVWDLGSLENGFWQGLEIALHIDPSAVPGSMLTHTLNIAPQPAEDRYDDNTSTWVDQLNPVGDNLRVTKQNYWWDGFERLSYEIRVYNLGTTFLDNLWVTDTYPLSTSFNDDWWVNHGPWITMTHNAAQRQLGFWVDGLNPGETASIGFRVDLDGGVIGQQGLSFTNLVDAPLAGDVFQADNHDQVTAYTGPDVYIEKTVAAGIPKPGELITFTVDFGNRNRCPWNGDSSYGSHITDTLPTGLSFVRATAPWNRTQTWDPETISGNQVAWAWGTMWCDSRWTFDVVAQVSNTVQGGDVLVNTIQAYGDSPYDVEPDWLNNQDEASITILNPLFSVGKTFESSQIAGMPVTYTLSLENLGNQTGSGVQLVDQVPAQVTYAASDGSYAAGTVTWNIPSLPVGGVSGAWFSGALSCQVGAPVVNDAYHVESSDQGVSSPDGAPLSFTILAPTLTASADASTVSAFIGQVVDFTGSGTTDGTPLSFSWDFGDGGTASGSAASHGFAALGSYTVTLTATDACGFSQTATLQVEVVPHALFLPVTRR